MTAIEFFQSFWAKVRETENWQTMVQTVEASEWHREANVAVHTTMAIEFYLANVAAQRTEREQLLTLMTLLFHDFGKPEAEETVERKDGSGSYHRYAGHEPISANEFISFVCDHPDLMKTFFNQGFTWDDIRKIKVMIEHHLPFGLKNQTKRENLRQMIAQTLGQDEQCFYDQLWCDCNGRISDNHEQKKEDCQNWIDDFKSMKPKKAVVCKSEKTMYVLCGPVGAGKSTWTRNLIQLNQYEKFVVISEDQYRLDFYDANLDGTEKIRWRQDNPKSRYAEAWQYCFDHSKEYDAYVKWALGEAIRSGCILVVDRTNQTRKARGSWIAAGKSAGYKIVAVEFYISESVSLNRQKTRLDKAVPANRVHQIFMNMESSWFTVEVDSYEIVPPWN